MLASFFGNGMNGGVVCYEMKKGRIFHFVPRRACFVT